MRTATLFAVVLALTGCRRSHPGAVAVEDVPAQPGPVDAAVAGSPPPPPIAPAPPTGRTTPPTIAEVKAALQPIFPAIGQCIARVTLPAAVQSLDLRFVVAPTGAVSEVKLFDLDDATACLTSAFERVHFPPWTGPATILNLSVQRSGEPVFLPTRSRSADGGT